MEFEQKERDPFAEFADFAELDSYEIELALAEASEVEPVSVETIDTAEAAATAKPKRIKTGFSWAGFGGGLAAFVWIAGAIGGPISYYGVDAVMAMDPTLQAGLIALAFGPAILFWLGAAAAGEAFKARRLATELTRLAQGSQLTFDSGETQVQRLSTTVKTEIESLNDAVAQAMVRLNELETSARRNAALFDDAIASSREHAEFMTSRLGAERDSLVEINGELRGQTENIAHSIGRQVRLMREASKLVKTEVSAAEDALESHLTSFAQSASVLAERTASFHDVADSAAHATSQLNATMSGVLDGLGEATKLTDAARRSAEEATLAATETATAVRDTTRHAVFEAKRAAQVIRAETEALQEAAVTTLDRLREAAEAARAASDESQAAADRHAASIEKRLSALASTAGAPRKPTPQPAARVEAKPFERPVERPVERQVERKVVANASIREEEHAEGALYAAAAAAVSRGQSRARTHAEPAPTVSAESRRGFSGGLKGFGAWNNLFPQRDDYTPRPANEPEEADAFDLVDFGARKSDPDGDLKAEALALLVSSGVDVREALDAADLEHVAQRSRLGAVARRRAVSDAAPQAVSRLARHIKRNADAKIIAADFRARPDLAKSEKKGEASDLVKAYLLIDAALDA